MLQAIRSKTASIVVKALAGLLIISFAAWGIEDFIGARATDTSVATVGDIDIDPFEFEYEVQRETQRMRRAFGGQLTDEQLIGLGVGNSVLQRMINDTALSLKSGDIGLRVSDDDVTRAIHADQNFHGFDGRFSRARFNEIMHGSGIPEQMYIERVRAELANTQLLDAVAVSAAAVPKRLSELVRSYRYESRTAETLLIRAEDQPQPAAPTQQQLETFHQAQAERFTAPEYRTITYVHLDPESLIDEITVDDEELQAAYDANAAEFIRRETRHIQQMVLDTEEQANEAKKQLAEGRDFITVAKEIAQMEEAAIDLGNMTRDGLLPMLADAAFGIAQGETTDPVETPLGWHIFAAPEVFPGEVRTLDDVRDEVRRLAAREKAVDALYDLSIRFEDAIGGGATVEEAASEIGVQSIVLGPVDRQGNTQAGAPAGNLPQIASALPVAFAAEEGIESPLTEAGERGFFMVRVDGIIAPALRPLDSIRADVEAAWAENAREEAARNIAMEYAEKVRNGGSLATLAADVPGEVEVIGPVRRNGGEPTQRSIVTQMFAVPEQSSDIAKVDGGYVVLRVTASIAPIADGGDVPTADDLRDELIQSVGQDMIAQMLQAVRSDFGVDVHERVYEEVLEPGPYQANNPNQRHTAM